MLEDWIELCKLFAAHAVEYLLVGGQAVIAHGYPRLTKDMDLWVRPTAHNGGRVLAALTEFGAAPAAFAAVRFTDPKTLIMLGKDPFRVDMRLAAGLRLPWQRRSRPTNSSKTLSPL